MSDVAITFAVIAAIVVLFVWGRLPVEVVSIGAALTLWATGVLTIEQSLAGFGDPTVIFIAALFVVSESLEVSGVTAWAGQQLINRAGTSHTRLLVLTMLVVAVLTAIITVNAAVAALLPVVVVAATRLEKAPSKLLIPLVFGAHAGSQLALTGSNVNLLVSGAVADYGGEPFAFFEFALVGIPLLVGTSIVVALLANRLLPIRTPRKISADLSQHARTLVRQYGLGTGAVAEAVAFNREIGLAEVVIPPRSALLGQRVFRGMVTESGDLVVAAIQRKGDDVEEEEVELAAGDVLLLQGPWAALDTKAEDPGVLVVDQPDAIRRQAVPLGLRAWEAIAGAGRDGGPAGDRPRAAGSRRAACRRRDRRPRDRLDGGSLPRDQLDHGDPRRRPASAFDRHVRDRRGRCGRRRSHRRRRRTGAVGPARRAVRGDRRLRAAHQQHGDGADHDSDRRRCRRRSSASTSARCS